METTTKKQQKGFALVKDEEAMRAIASKGGKAAHRLGLAHEWTHEEAQAAGRKGGKISRRRKKQPPPSA